MNKNNFPVLKRQINGRRLTYLDNAATTQKPDVVISAVSDFYKKHNANIHRGIHTLSREATELYEETRDKIQEFINAKHREEIIFTSGATESINLVASSWGERNIKPGDEIVLTEMEHHSNLVPWQELCKKKKAKLKYIPIDETGGLELETLDKILTQKTKLVAVVHISNFLGTINPVEKIIKQARKIGAKVLIDGAQAGGHMKIDVRKLNADFYVLSGHKMYGPTGVGVLYGKRDILKQMPPYQLGGHMIKKVEFTETEFADLPYKFEAGTAHISGVIGLGTAVDYINDTGLSAIMNHESGITNYALKALGKIEGIEIYGPDVKNRGPIIAFNVRGVPAHDLASILDEYGVAVRTGHHCAQPVHGKLGLESSARVSFAIYNTKKDIAPLIVGIKSAKQKFQLN